MTIFGAMTTAISGLTAQSKSLGNISDNVANSQTVGYKRVDTNFLSYITTSSNLNNDPGTVIARPGYTNDVQGPTQTADNPLALAIGGQGMFSVALANGTVGSSSSQPTFDERQFYTRAGDFAQDANGYMVNSSGYFLQGWKVTDATTGALDRTSLKPIQVSQQTYNPIKTSTVDLSANLPAEATTSASAIPALTTNTKVYDALGNQHDMQLSFTPANDGASPPANLPNTWDMEIIVKDNTDGAGTAVPTLGKVRVVFNNGTQTFDSTIPTDPPFGNPPPAPNAGTVYKITDTSASPTTFAEAQGTDVNNPLAAFQFTADFGQGAQQMTFSLGGFNKADGLTQFGGASGTTPQFTLHNLSQNGVALGSFSGLSIRTTGDVAVNYDNGQSRIIARVPLVTFKDVDKLQRLDGQAYMRTVESGDATVTDAASNGAGKLVTGSVETSNVDIATEFTKMIVAQRAYSANTKVVTTADQMLQDTINMSR